MDNETRRYLLTQPGIDTDPPRIGTTETGNTTREEGRKADIARYRKEIKKQQRKKETLMRFKDRSKIGRTLGKIEKEIRFYKDLIDKALKVGKYDYPDIYSDTRDLIIRMNKKYSHRQMAEKAGCARSDIVYLRSKSYRNVSETQAHNIYELLLGVAKREDL